MRRISFALVILFLAGSVPRAFAKDSDAFEFFSLEAKVVSASLQPQILRRAPATVYVLTSAEIKASGAQTLWDALRSVPGLDVMSTRAFYGEVSIRGLNKPLNNRTLVLLDGRTVLNGYFDFVNWEGIPVTLDEIDRIEVVEGPGSALFGANAINGVINIITKPPEQMAAGFVSYTQGSNDTQFGTGIFSHASEHTAYRASLRWRDANGFEDTGLLSSEVGSASAMLRYRTANATLSVSGALSNLNTQFSAGVAGTSYEDGTTGFARADYTYKATRARVFWNRGRTVARDLFAYQNADLRYDTQDVNLEQSISSTARNTLVVGSGYRQNSIRSQILEAGLHRQSLWALFSEDSWALRPNVNLLVSGRLDRHPLAGLVFSPRASVSFSPSSQHTLRLSAGSAFRNPTLTENYLDFTYTNPNPGTSIPNPPYDSIQVTIRGNHDLGPERLLQFEVSHLGKFGDLQTRLTAFHYELEDMVTTRTTQSGGAPPTFTVEQSFTNDGRIVASGGEASLEYRVRAFASVFGNYSYQSLGDEGSVEGAGAQSPRHKANAGLRYRTAGLTTNMIANWVDHTSWSSGPNSTVRVSVPGYVLLNLGAAYAFSGTLHGLEARLSAFNAANNRHHEILPAQSPTEPGQNGEVIGRRVAATIAYSF
ncbi:MAG TPA: TonB-dependent receptor [Candidatus Limnocylindrales bacterium]|nr:TonB-dependent receptor [Candidatus Limnocylindrales bacterium]